MTPTTRTETTADGITVWTVWPNVDRPETSGIQVADTPAGRALAVRLETAIRHGAVHSDAEVKVDRDGKTYVSATCNVIGRRLNADLARLGY